MFIALEALCTLSSVQCFILPDLCMNTPR